VSGGTLTAKALEIISTEAIETATITNRIIVIGKKSSISANSL